MDEYRFNDAAAVLRWNILQLQNALCNSCTVRRRRGAKEGVGAKPPTWARHLSIVTWNVSFSFSQYSRTELFVFIDFLSLVRPSLASVTPQSFRNHYDLVNFTTQKRSGLKYPIRSTIIGGWILSMNSYCFNSILSRLTTRCATTI